MRRANSRLLQGGPESLFYAALELRCGLETRLYDYLDAERSISKRKKKGWKIAGAAMELDRVFKTGDKIVEATILDEKSEQLRFILYFTPVRKRLQEAGGKLGNLLHRLKEDREDDDPWWRQTRLFLQQVSDDLAFSVRGTLLGPIMKSPTGSHYSCLYVADECPVSDEIVSFTKVGHAFSMSVSYHDSLPAYAERYLNPNDALAVDS